MAASEITAELMDPTKKVIGWIVGPTYNLGEKEFRYVWEDMQALKILHKLPRKAYNVRTGEMFIEMPWGSRVEVKSAQYPDGLVGEGLDFAVFSEAAKHSRSTWEKQIRPALADTRGWAVFPSTPEGFNWYYDLYMLGKDDRYPDYESWNFPSWDNPYVYPGGFDDPEIQSQLRSPDDPWFWQELGASFRSFVGKIYKDWTDDLNVVNHVYNTAWPNYIFFDFGYAAPFVALDVQVSPSDEMYVWREWYKPGMPTYRHAQELKVRTNPPGYEIRCGFGDAADPGAIETLSTMLCPCYGDPDAKDWSLGIKTVTELLAPYVDEQGVRRSHLYVDPSCKNTIFEFQNYRLKAPTKDDENPKEDPKKWADHSMDAIRYGAMHLFVLGAKHHLTEVYKENHVVNPDVGPGDPPDYEERRVENGSFFTVPERSVFTLSGSNKPW
jgi:hypothetical protein